MCNFFFLDGGECQKCLTGINLLCKWSVGPVSKIPGEFKSTIRFDCRKKNRHRFFCVRHTCLTVQGSRETLSTLFLVRKPIREFFNLTTYVSD